MLSGALRKLLPHVMDPMVDLSDKETDLPPPPLVVKFNPVPPPLIAPSDQRIFSVFNHGALFEQKDTSSLPVGTYRTIAASVVYNIALSYHLIGLQGAHRGSDFDKALKAYKAARDLLNATGESQLSATNDVNLLTLAIVNNMGHIHEQFYQLESAKDCLQELHMLLPQTSWSEQSAKLHLTGLLFPPQGGLCPQAPAA